MFEEIYIFTCLFASFSVNLGVDTQVRDVQLVSMEATPYLLIGLGDGTLISFSIQFTTGLPVLVCSYFYPIKIVISLP
jgi:hypothetical protein